MKFHTTKSFNSKLKTPSHTDRQTNKQRQSDHHHNVLHRSGLTVSEVSNGPIRFTAFGFEQFAKPSSFLSLVFDPDSYISDLRSYVPFNTLRAQLQSHLTLLKHDLVDLINRDYNDFVSLTTKLLDVDHVVARMRAPLVDLGDTIIAFRAAVEDSLVKLQTGLAKRAEAAQVREALELLLPSQWRR